MRNGRRFVILLFLVWFLFSVVFVYDVPTSSGLLAGGERTVIPKPTISRIKVFPVDDATDDTKDGFMFLSEQTINDSTTTYVTYRDLDGAVLRKTDSTSEKFGNSPGSYTDAAFLNNELYLLYPYTSSTGGNGSSIKKYTLGSTSATTKNFLGLSVTGEDNFYMTKNRMFFVDQTLQNGQMANTNRVIVYNVSNGTISTSYKFYAQLFDNSSIKSIAANPSGDYLYARTDSAFVCFKNANGEDWKATSTNKDSEIDKTSDATDVGIQPNGKYKFLDDTTIIDSLGKVYRAAEAGGTFEYKFSVKPGLTTPDEKLCDACIYDDKILVPVACTDSSTTFYLLDRTTGEPLKQFTVEYKVETFCANGKTLLLVKDPTKYSYAATYPSATLFPKDDLVVETLKSDSTLFKDVLTEIIHDSSATTKENVEALWKAAVPTHKDATAMYTSAPDATSYSQAGTVNDAVLTDGLNAINFYRNLYGLEELTLDTTLSENAQWGALLALNVADLEKPTQPEGMSTDNFNKAKTGWNPDCIIKTETLTASAISDAVHELFNTNVTFRNMVLFRDVSTVGFGLASDLEGKTAVLVNFADGDELNVKEKFGSDFVAYPPSGFYHTKCADSCSEWSVKINTDELAMGERVPIVEIYDSANLGTPLTTISTKANPEVDPNNGFELLENNSCITFPAPEGIKAGAAYTVRVKNVYKKGGSPVYLEYKVEFFDITETPTGGAGDENNPGGDNGNTPGGDENNPGGDNGNTPGDQNKPGSGGGTQTDPTPTKYHFDVIDYSVDENNRIISGITPPTTFATFKQKFSCSGYTLEFLNHNGKVPTSGNVGTGAKVRLMKEGELFKEYTVLVYGDLTGEGNIKTNDTRALLKHLLRVTPLTGINLLAADVTHNGHVNTADLLLMTKHIAGTRTISQKT